MFSKKIKDLRKKHKLTQMELGKELGISASTIGMYEQGRRQPDYQTTLKMCEYFGVSLDYLLKDNHDEVREIDDVISEIKNTLLAQKGLMFNGQPLDDDDLKKIVDTVELSIKVLALDKR